MHQRLVRYLDVASIYAVIVLFGISAVDYVTVDQTKRVSGLTMLILIAGIIMTRLLARQQRQINALRGRLPRQEPVAAPAPTTPPQQLPTRLPAAEVLPANVRVLDFQRR